MLLHFRRQERRKFFQRQRAVVADRNETQSGADPFGQQLPRHEIAVVFHFGEQNHVAVAQEFCAPRLRDHIDAFSRAAGENDLVRSSCTDEIGDALAGFFVMLGRPSA